MAIQFQVLSFDEAERDDLRYALRLTPAERFRRGIDLFERNARLTRPTMRLVEDFHLNLIRLFNELNLDYIVVGGHAVNAHGYLRGSDDFDVWLANTTPNLITFRRALKRLGVAEDDVYRLVHTLARPNDQAVFRFRFEGYPVDFLLHLYGVTDYDTAKARCLLVPVADTSIPFLSLEDLITAKRATGRLKDQLDVQKLEQIEEEKHRQRSPESGEEPANP